MPEYSENIVTYTEAIATLKHNIITNVVLLGELPNPSWEEVAQEEIERENKKTRIFWERLLELGVDECSMDSYGNPIGVIKGTNSANPPIMLVAHMDTVYHYAEEHHYEVGEDAIKGAGIIDNSLGVGVLLSIPEILRALDFSFESDILLVGLVHSLGKSNLRSIRSLLSAWKTPIRGAICVEGGEIGRLNYFSRSMRRAEIACAIPQTTWWENERGLNAILILNEVINKILKIRLPQRPETDIVLGKISGGIKHGNLAAEAKLGFEIQSHSDKMVTSVFSKIEDIVSSIAHENRVHLGLSTISDVNAANLGYKHPLVKHAVSIMEALEIMPIIESSESELSIFLSHGIPAVTLGITHGENYHREDAAIEIAPIFRGVAQIIALMQGIDKGVCDE